MATAPIPRWTVADAVESDSCYAKLHILELWAGRESLSVLEVLDLDIPVEDRMWAASRMICGHPVGEIARVLTLTRVITKYALPYEATREWAKRWLSGEDRTFASAKEAERAVGVSACPGLAALAAAGGLIGPKWSSWAAWAAEAEELTKPKRLIWVAWTAEFHAQIADIRTAVQSYEGAS